MCLSNNAGETSPELSAELLASAWIASARARGASDATIHAAAEVVERVARASRIASTDELALALRQYNAADASLQDVTHIRDAWGRQVLRLLAVRSDWTTISFAGATRRYRLGSIISRVLKARSRRQREVLAS